MGAGLHAIEQRIAEELGVRDGQVRAAVGLLDGGATVPFVARYRKEVTGGLDDAQLRTLEDRLGYLRELEERRLTVLASIDEQDSLTDEVRAQVMAAETKARLEDIYLPFKPKRRTKAQIAKEAGLAPLADGLLSDPSVSPQGAAAAFVDESRASPTLRPRSTAPGPSSSSASPRRPTSSVTCASDCGRGGTSPPRSAGARRPTAPSSRTTSTSPSRSRRCPPTGFSRCCAARRRRSSR